ncbi:nucleotidyltransferase domain-containing protein [Candidatus Kaiserbacteria bacterium]|nr:nucleotidyltransferase domain-containing protein [Candidatus Kaiserbacteria bacterium]
MEEIRLTTEVKEKLVALGVAVLYLHGSRARGTAREDSDYDIGVVFADPKKAILDMHQYGMLYGVLNDIYPDHIDGPKLDIALLQRANAALQMSAINYGIVLFENDPKVRADYEEGVVKRYDDYRFLQKEYEDATFAAFAHRPQAYV